MRKFIAMCLFLIPAALPLAAQTAAPALKLPRLSQHMVTTQTVGLAPRILRGGRSGWCSMSGSPTGMRWGHRGRRKMWSNFRQASPIVGSYTISRKRAGSDIRTL